MGRFKEKSEWLHPQIAALSVLTSLEEKEHSELKDGIFIAHPSCTISGFSPVLGFILLYLVNIIEVFIHKKILCHSYLIHSYFFFCYILNLVPLSHLSVAIRCLKLDSSATAAPLIKCLFQDHYFQSSNYMLVSFIDWG